MRKPSHTPTYSLSTCFNILLCSLCFLSCSCNRSPTGNDRDCHGCIGSAGYQWSELLQECIQPFEKGIELLPVGSGNDGSESGGTAKIAAYLVFNADRSKVEVYMHELEGQPILQKDAIAVYEAVWTSGKKGTPVVRQSGSKYELLLDGVVKYQQK